MALDHVDLRFRKALTLGLGKRLDCETSAPTTLKLEHDFPQESWIQFLRGMEPLFPGITGTARNLLTTLSFGLSKLVGVARTVEEFEWYIEGVEAFCRFLVRRMVNARSAFLRSAEELQLRRLKDKVLFKLADGPMPNRDLYRALSLKAARCLELMQMLEAESLVERSEGMWRRVEPVVVPAVESQNSTCTDRMKALADVSFQGRVPPWTPPDQLRQLCKPGHRVLAEFIHGCSPDPATRTNATASLVLSLWQLAGRGMTRQLPSMILLNAGEAETDPIDSFVHQLVGDDDRNKPEVQTSGVFAYGSVEQATKAMENAILRRQEIGDPHPDHPWRYEEIRLWEDRFRAAQCTAFGAGRSRPFSKAWQEPFGLLTGRDDEIILRIVDAGDREAFREDVLENCTKLEIPMGYGAGLELVPKTISVTGSLTPDLWDGELVEGILELGSPIHFPAPYLAGVADGSKSASPRTCSPRRCPGSCERPGGGVRTTPSIRVVRDLRGVFVESLGPSADCLPVQQSSRWCTNSAGCVTALSALQARLEAKDGSGPGMPRFAPRRSFLRPAEPDAARHRARRRRAGLALCWDSIRAARGRWRSKSCGCCGRTGRCH